MFYNSQPAQYPKNKIDKNNLQKIIKKNIIKKSKRNPCEEIVVIYSIIL